MFEGILSARFIDLTMQIPLITENYLACIYRIYSVISRSRLQAETPTFVRVDLAQREPK